MKDNFISKEEEKRIARNAKLWATCSFLLVNTVVSILLLLVSRRISLLLFFVFFLFGTIPKFLSSIVSFQTYSQQQQQLQTVSIVPVKEDDHGPSSIQRITPSPPTSRFRISDQNSPIKILALIPIYHEDKEELLEGVQSFLLSRLPFSRSCCHLVFVIDGIHTRDGPLDTSQTKTIFDLLSILFPGQQFCQSPTDGSIALLEDLQSSNQSCSSSITTYLNLIEEDKNEPLIIASGIIEDYSFSVVIKHKNRGKRDSQSLCFRLMSNGIVPKVKDAILIMDSDSAFESQPQPHSSSPSETAITDDTEIGITRTDSLMKLYFSLMSDSQLGGVTGEIEVSNYGENIYTIMQWFEYKSNHFLSKVSESKFGVAQCLAGAFSLLRAEALETVLEEYCSPAIGLWQRNLLDLGEDRTLSTMLLQTGWKTKFVEGAVARTKAPNSSIQLIKQRRRWTNSTWINQFLLFSSLIHNKMALSCLKLPIVIGMLFCEILSSVLFPGITICSFVQLFCAFFGNEAFIPSTIILLLWALLIVIVSLLFRIERVQWFFQLSTFIGVLFVSAQIGGMLFFALTQFWTSIVELSFAACWLGILLVSSWKHGQFGAIATCTWMLGPLCLLLLQPLMSIVIEFYAISNLDDLSWGTR